MRLGHPKQPDLAMTPAVLVIAASLVALALAPLPARAQQATGEAVAQVAMLQPGSVVKVADMEFGRITQPQSAGTVVLSPNSTATCTVTGGLVRIGPCRAAAFSLLATKQGRARLHHPGNGTITLSGPGGATMLVTNLTLGLSDLSQINGGGNANLGRYEITSQSGIATFRLGGTLHVNAGQVPGLYNGELIIDVQFN